MIGPCNLKIWAALFTTGLENKLSYSFMQNSPLRQKWASSFYHCSPAKIVKDGCNWEYKGYFTSVLHFYTSENVRNLFFCLRRIEMDHWPATGQGSLPLMKYYTEICCANILRSHKAIPWRNKEQCSCWKTELKKVTSQVKSVG